MALANTSIEELFNLLDVNRDKELSRAELHQAAQRLGWHWYQAPLYAVLDLLTIRSPLSKSTFISHMNQILRDPDGPYGRVLLHSELFTHPPSKLMKSFCGGSRGAVFCQRRQVQVTGAGEELENDIKNEADFNRSPMPWGPLAAGGKSISSDRAGLLIIDPQRSFTSGVWVQSIGLNAKSEVEPICLAFDNCARMLSKLGGRVETMFTRCPFPPDSYGWDERFNKVIKKSQLYFIKPGNSVMWPTVNGFREWVQRLLAHNKKTLVMGGCTLNSCVRVSSIDTMELFKSHGLQVVVDLSICGARAGNFTASPQYSGLSSVESAVQQMKEAGVQVVRHVIWK
jgi:hypothetical protein